MDEVMRRAKEIPCTCLPTDSGPYHKAGCPRGAYWNTLPGIGERPGTAIINFADDTTGEQ